MLSRRLAPLLLEAGSDEEKEESPGHCCQPLSNADHYVPTNDQRLGPIQILSQTPSMDRPTHRLLSDDSHTETSLGV